jgi:hypothetical protein
MSSSFAFCARTAARSIGVAAPERSYGGERAIPGIRRTVFRATVVVWVPVCEHSHRKNLFGDEKRVAEILSELVPEKERGKYLMGSFLNLGCAGQDVECGGVEEDWEKLTILRMGTKDAEHYAALHWKRDECKDTYIDVSTDVQ